MFGRVVPGLVSAYCRTAEFCRRVDMAVERLVGGFAVEAMSAEEKRRLTIGRYQRGGAAGRGTALFDWEQGWFEQRLPSPPARLLVGGCGAGREIAWLLDRQYAVDGFDPAARLVAEARRCVGDRAQILQLAYEDLVACVLGGGVGPAAPLARRSYDAIVLGWTSFTHVLDRTARADLLAVLNRLCPDGPVLCSFWEEAEPETIGRAERLGRMMGGTIRRARRLPAPAPTIVFRPHAGFGYLFSKAEMVELASAAGRIAICEDGGWFPHATLVRPPA